MSLTRKLLLTMVLGLLLIFLQGAVLQYLVPEWLAVPNLLISMVVFLAFFEASAFGCILAFLLGLELDLSSGVLLGPWAGSFVAVFCVLASLSQRLFIESGLAAAVAVFVSSIISQTVYIVFTYDVRPFGSHMFIVLLLDAVACSALAPWLFRLYRWLFLPGEVHGKRFRGAGG